MLLQKPIRYLYHHVRISLIKNNGHRWAAQRLEIAIAPFLAACISAWFSLPLLNAQKVTSEGQRSAMNQAEEVDLLKSHSTTPRRAGRTIDLTLFASTRALEAIIVNIWRYRNRLSSQPLSPLSKLLSYHTDTIVFVASCSTIMWNWAYYPKTLPRAYNRWIASVAQVDPRLIEILRLARRREFVYGENKGPEGRQCEQMCKEYGWPIEWGDPQRTIPLPCEVVHMGAGPNCHWHACVRFTRAFRFAMATNFPLQLVARVISKRRLSLKDLVHVTTDCARSSAFLGAFVSLFYYGICLSRTQLGPRLFSQNTVSRQDWDSGLCVQAACMLCGWSILIEKERRRGELSMFVVPRAVATFLPRIYDSKCFWRERTAFSVSIGVLFALAQEDKGMLRGVFGRLLNGILT